jgi:gamma-tubulin complex component 3
VQDVSPLQTIFTKEVMTNYLKIFSFLWKLKKIQHYLSISWGINMANQAQFRTLRGSLPNQFHRFNIAHHEMAHFF